MNKVYRHKSCVLQKKKDRLFPLLYACLLLFLFQACSATPPPRMYELGTSVPPKMVKDASLPVLYVADPFLPKYLDRPQIITRKGDMELSMEDRHRWAAPLGELLAERISAGLNERLSSVRVLSGERALLYPTPAMRLEVHVVEFTSDDEGKSLLSGTYLLWTQNDKGKETPFLIRTNFKGKSMEAKIASLGQAVDMLCREIGDFLDTSEAKKPTP